QVTRCWCRFALARRIKGGAPYPDRPHGSHIDGHRDHETLDLQSRIWLKAELVLPRGRPQKGPGFIEPGQSHVSVPMAGTPRRSKRSPETGWRQARSI